MSHPPKYLRWVFSFFLFGGSTKETYYELPVPGTLSDNETALYVVHKNLPTFQPVAFVTPARCTQRTSFVNSFSLCEEGLIAGAQTVWFFGLYIKATDPFVPINQNLTVRDISFYHTKVFPTNPTSSLFDFKSPTMQSREAAQDIYAAWRAREASSLSLQSHEAVVQEKENTTPEEKWSPVAIKSTIQRRFQTFRRRSQGPLARRINGNGAGERQSTGEVCPLRIESCKI